jgi:HK97 family phage portal protein
MTPEDAQLIETRKYEKGDICTAFGVPPIMIGDSEKTTSWGTGIEQITIGFVRYTLKPHLVRWEEELNRKLFGSPKRFVEFEVDGLLRGDSKAQADYFTAALGGPGAGPGWMTVNEVRKLRNLEPVDNGDELYYPKDGNEQQVSSAA